MIKELEQRMVHTNHLIKRISITILFKMMKKKKEIDLSSVLSMLMGRHLPIQTCTFIEILQGLSWLHNKKHEEKISSELDTS